MALLPTSYTSQRYRFPDLVRDSYNLYRSHSNNVSSRVDTIVDNLESLERLSREHFGLELRNLSILDIGCGQLLTHLIYFSRYNQAVGIDWDVVPHGINPGPYVTMLMANGPRRTMKTIGRKLLGIDRRHRTEVMNRLNLHKLPDLMVYRMDACNMRFRDASFDFVHSYSVFHHLPDPKAAVREVVRVLKDQGVAYLSFHLFSSETGCLNSRVVLDENGDIAYWPHLRRQFADQVSPNAFLNKLRLRDWQKLFEEEMPGAEFIMNKTGRSGAKEDAKALLECGELAEYSLEELLVHDVTVLWRKPVETKKRGR